MLIRGTTELAAVQLVLKSLGEVLMRTNLMSFSTSSLFFDFCFTVMSNVDRDWNPASQTGAWGKLVERFPKTVVEEPNLAHMQTIVAIFWKTCDLFQILLKCGFRLVHEFFNRAMQKPVFSLRLFGRLSCNSSKTCWNSIHYPTFMDIITDLTWFVWSFQNIFGRWLEKARQNLSAKLSKGIRGIFEKWRPEVTVSRSPPQISNPAHRGRWKRMEADNEKGA